MSEKPGKCERIIMRKRDDKKNRKEIFRSLAMILQMGLAMLTCMGMSMAIGFYIDRLFGTKYWVMIMMLIGIMAAIRSLLVLSGRYTPGQKKQGDENGKTEKGNIDEDSQN